MDNEDVIRNQMEDTRTSLTDKLETLEKQVADSVHVATANVAHTVESVTDTVTSVKDSVEETVTAVKDSMRQGVNAVKDFLDLSQHVQSHPWAMVGGSVVVGYVVGSVLGGRSETSHAGTSESRSQPAAANGATNGRHEVFASPSPPSGGLLSSLAPEISKLKGLALGALVGAVREMIQKAVPPDLGSSLDEIFTSITEKVTGGPSRAQPGETLRR
ncbi:MAG TPA: hypothetical protein VNX28_04675 [Gemmataceae bacterium]|jgi:ElaB/YqjD/DUF883 family membrane-anchored ribosome-binding protein|nr:hypothetical protein [Gemmataceae bacterium]